MNAAMLMGRIGTLRLTRGLLILKVSKRATTQLKLMIVATIRFHTGVVGIVAAASSIDEIKS